LSATVGCEAVPAWPLDRPGRGGRDVTRWRNTWTISDKATFIIDVSPSWDSEYMVSVFWRYPDDGAWDEHATRLHALTDRLFDALAAETDWGLWADADDEREY